MALSPQTIYEKFSTDAGQDDLALLYGDDASAREEAVERYVHLLEGFETTYGDAEGVRLFSTPGRSEISGNHTDHQHGRVLVAAIDLDVIAAVRPTEEPTIRLVSEGYGRGEFIDIRDLEVREEEKGRTAGMIRGVLKGLDEAGYRIGGFEAYSTSRVPPGSGLSSSAAFEILMAGIQNLLYNDGIIEPLEQAKICQFAENVYFGKPSGLLDQCGCAVGGFAYLDFKDPRDPQLEQISAPFGDADIHLVITETGGDHADLTHCYAAIPEEMKAVADYFDADYLREVDPDAFNEALPELHATFPERPLLRAMHFFEEDYRVAEQRIALLAGDIRTFLDLVNESGLSSQLLLQNIYDTETPERQPISLALTLSRHLLERRGGSWRVHGGGFAGTMLAFVPGQALDDYLGAMRAVFGESAVKVLSVRPVGTYELLADDAG